MIVLRRYQERAIRELREKANELLELQGRKTIVFKAPTGSGKTWIAIQAITDIFKKSGRAWYASPLKALTNSKYAEFSGIFGQKNVGILTGDRKENPFSTG